MPNYITMSLAGDQEASAPIEHATSAPSPEGAAEGWKPVTGEGRPAARVPRTIFLLGAAGFLVAISWQVVLPFLPLHLSNIGYSAAQIGALVSLLSLAMGAVELEVGRIAGWFGRRWTLLGGVLGNAGAMIWVVQARMASLVAGGLAVVGASRAAMWAPLFASVADTASAETQGRMFAVFWFCTSVAFVVGPALGGLIVSLYGVRAAFYVGSALSLLTIPAIIAAVPREHRTSGVTAAGAEKVLRIPAIFRVCLANHLYYAVSGIWTTFLPLYAISQDVSPFTVGWVFTIQGSTYALVQIPAGRLLDRLGPARLVLPALIGRSLMTASAPLLHTPVSFLLAGVVFGLAGGFLPVPLTTLVARLVPREDYTTAMGVYNSSGDLGFFVGPLLGGAAALLGILAPFFLCVPLGLAAIAAGLSGMSLAERSHAGASL